MNYERELETAVEAAREGSQLIRQHAGRIGGDDVRDKGTHDMVTAADEAVQRLITDRLTGAFPDYDVLAEEGTDLRRHAASSGGYRWIVDPIDGTTNFLHGVPPYAISIALQYEDEVVVGVVLEASSGDLYEAVQGEGTYVNRKAVYVSETAILDQALLATGFPYRSFDHLEEYLGVLRRLMLGAQGLRRRGSAAIDLAHVACGRFSGFFETGLRPWDVAAGILLVEEAGGRVTDYRDQSNPLFAQQILATNGHVHEALLDELVSMQDVRS